MTGHGFEIDLHWLRIDVVTTVAQHVWSRVRDTSLLLLRCTLS